MPVDYLKFVEDLTAGVKWFNGHYGRRLRGTVGLLGNGLAELSRQAFLQRLPGHPEQARDSLDACGYDRDLLFYQGETEAQWLDRVVNAWETYGYSSTPQSVKVAVEAWGAATFPTTWVAGNVELVEHNYLPTNKSSLVGWYDLQDPLAKVVTVGAPDTVTSLTNKKTGVAMTAAATTFPQHEATGYAGRACMRGDGVARSIIGTDPLVVNTFVGEDKPFTVVVACSVTNATPGQSYFCAANSGVSTNSLVSIGRISTGINRVSRVDDIGGTSSSTATPVSATGIQVVAAAVNSLTAALYINLSAPDPAAGSFSTPGQTTPNRFAFLCRPDNGPDSFSNDRIAGALIYNEDLPDYELREAILWSLGQYVLDSTNVDFTVYISTAACGWGAVPFTYGSGRTYGDGSIYGSNALAKDISMLKKTINKYKRGASKGRVVVYNTHPGDTVLSFMVQ
jgi:hypothetical protein